MCSGKVHKSMFLVLVLSICELLLCIVDLTILLSCFELQHLSGSKMKMGSLVKEDMGVIAVR